MNMNLIPDPSARKDPDKLCDHYPCECLKCSLNDIKDCIRCGKPIIEACGRWFSLAEQN